MVRPSAGKCNRQYVLHIYADSRDLILYTADEEHLDAFHSALQGLAPSAAHPQRVADTSSSLTRRRHRGAGLMEGSVHAPVGSDPEEDHEPMPIFGGFGSPDQRRHPL